MPETFGGYAADWLARERYRFTARTVVAYEGALRNYLRDLDDVPLVSITRRLVRELIGILATRLAPATVHLALAVLSAVLSDAVDADLLGANPALHLKKPRLQNVRASDVPDPETVTKVLAMAPVVAPGLAALYTALARAGLRVGEAQALQADDCDVTHDLLRIERAVHKGGAIGPPKGGKARVVAISAQLRASLLRCLEDAHPHRWLFPGRFGPIGYTAVRYTLDRITAAAGVARLRPHALRHFYASNLRVGGVDLLWLRDQMGHASVAMTEKYAGHLPPPRPGMLDRT